MLSSPRRYNTLRLKSGLDKKIWRLEELVEHWTLLPNELEKLAQKNDQNTLGFSLLLKFFQIEARFPEN